MSVKAKTVRTVADLTPRTRRICLGFADRVAEFAIDAPNDDTRRIVYEAANRIRKAYGFSEVEKAAYVLGRVKIGASTTTDLVRETGFDQGELGRILNDLQDAGEVVLRKQSLSGNGRPAMLYFPAEDHV